MSQYHHRSFVGASERKPRRIVTVSGRGVRGVFPSRKSLKPVQFESLTEEMALRILEVSPTVREITTQPCVFTFVDGDRERRYTPDVAATTLQGTVYFEIKDEQALADGSDTAERLRMIFTQLKKRRQPLHLLLRGDLLAGELQDQLKRLLRIRPQPGRRRSNLDTSVWDPEHHTIPDDIIAAQWETAKHECDALLQRVMRRDPDELLPLKTR